MKLDWLYVGAVMHRRSRPAANAFRYRVFFLRFPLSRVAELSNAVFSINRFNLLSFHFADHGDGGDPVPWIRALLTSEGVDDADGEIFLQTFPRVLGYVFNPVSFWFCHRADGGLRAIVAEVNNTFGERHCYLLQGAQADAPLTDREILRARKVFHVSPFCRVEGAYRFRFHCARRGAGGHVLARIDFHDDAGLLLATSVSGSAHPYNVRSLVAACMTHPMMTIGVIARIHWQALQLWRKRVPFFSKPAPPQTFVTR